MDQLHGYYFEDLEKGMMDVFGKTITDADIITFAGIFGDTNPLPLRHGFKSETIFEGRIARGMLTASFISTVIITKMPGPGCIYVSQNLRFKAPVWACDAVTATCVVVKLIPEKRFIELSKVSTVDGTPVVEGEATIMVPSRIK
jgi:3-hydroxybutyryl-CoA dehydratase